MDAQQEARDAKLAGDKASQATDSESSQDSPPTEETQSGIPETGIHVEEIDDFASVLAEYESGLKAVKEGEVVARDGICLI